jgi:hypothetical protein
VNLHALRETVVADMPPRKQRDKEVVIVDTNAAVAGSADSAPGQSENVVAGTKREEEWSTIAHATQPAVVSESALASTSAKVEATQTASAAAVTTVSGNTNGRLHGRYSD